MDQGSMELEWVHFDLQHKNKRKSEGGNPAKVIGHITLSRLTLRQTCYYTNHE